MERINEFYKDILETLGLEVDSNGGIFLKSGKTKIPLTINGLPAVLPTTENIKNVIDTSGEKPEVQFFLFNPAYEDPIRKNTSLQKLREIIYRRLENKIVAIMETLSLIGLEDDIKSTGMEEFVELVLRFKNKAVKKLFDEGVVEVIRNIYSVSKKSTNPKLNFLHIFLNKGGKIGNDRYNRIGNAAFPIYETLINDFSVKKDTIEGIKLRNKDKGVILSAYEFVIKNPDDLLNGIIIGSKNKVAPGLHVILILMYMLIDKINEAVESIKEDIDEDTYNALRMNKPKISLEELDKFLTELKEDIEYIPNEKDIEALLKQGVGTVPSGVNYKEPIINNVTPVAQQPQEPDPLDKLIYGDEQLQPVYNVPPIQQPIPQPVQPQQPQQLDPLDALLMGGY